ncbi:hypothetical protein OESDEN_19038 [Oesophagostomum dentatum]|uniref:Uncharacterized protein n=1 Tax=Oesophagostomum dentatum TaxID=61180 RepID=A0A0B1SBL1_OESDE|nr:hypothetical protein OESDEN_19038 [Oesophagostomum dentatum]
MSQFHLRPRMRLTSTHEKLNLAAEPCTEALGRFALIRSYSNIQNMVYHVHCTNTIVLINLYFARIDNFETIDKPYSKGLRCDM